MTTEPFTPAPVVLRAWSPAVRWTATLAQLVAWSALTVLTILFGLHGEEALPPLPRDLFFLFGVLLPLALQAALRWGAKARLTVGPDTLVLEQRATRFEIPRSTVSGVSASGFLLPEPTAELVLGSGRRFERALTLSEPVAALGSVSTKRLAFATARLRWHRVGALPLVFKYGVFPLLLTTVFFRAHQVITYGGPFGEYRVFGLRKYLVTFFHFEATTLLYLAVIAFVLRAVAEAVTLAAAQVAPGIASGFRRSAEIAVRFVYYVAVPALVLVRFLS
jgi:hypothetical protein